MLNMNFGQLEFMNFITLLTCFQLAANIVGTIFQWSIEVDVHSRFLMVLVECCADHGIIHCYIVTGSVMNLCGFVVYRKFTRR